MPEISMVQRSREEHTSQAPASGATLEALEHALGAALVATTSSVEGPGPLRDAICDYVAWLRDSGAPPEQVVVSFKRLVAGAHPDPRATPRELMQALVTACIEVYFGP